jgi:hypothetical protein
MGIDNLRFRYGRRTRAGDWNLVPILEATG